MTLRHRAADGTVTERVDGLGGVFLPIIDKGITTPVWIYGPPKQEQVMFSCPVSSIPTEVMDLLALWWACRHLHTLPLAGGFLDQPLSVQHAWPYFEMEYAAVEATLAR